MRAILRADEQASIKNLPEPPPETTHAISMVAVTRVLYAAIEKPPTRHGMFIIRTRWRRDGWVAEHHGIFVKVRGWNSYRQVVEDRPGVFGA